MAYNRRDLIGHWVKREQRTQQPCQHACCRGYRVHPRNYPVILPDRTLRRARDEDLAQHFRRVSDDPSPKARRAELQILHEMERRDQAEQHRQEREQRRTETRQARQAGQATRRMEREAETERIRLEAEAATQGYLVNPRGRARGIADYEILTGRIAVFERYATDEARDYFTAHPRPTAAYFRGEDTRFVERATEPVRRRRGVVQRTPRKTRALGWSEPALVDLRR